MFAIKGDPLAVVALLGLLAGLMALRLITRPLHRLTETIRNFGSTGEAAPPLPAAPATASTAMAERDEIAVLEQTFLPLGARIGDQWQHLSQLDQDRRLVANISQIQAARQTFGWDQNAAWDCLNVA